MNWYDYKMLCVSSLMKYDMYIKSDKKGIHIFKDYKNGYPLQHILSYKRSITWERFFNEIVPKITGQKA